MMWNRKELLAGAGAAALLGFAGESEAAARALRRVERRWLVTEDDAIAWHRLKDAQGPALTGNASWRSFMAFLEAKLGEYGCVDVQRSPWRFRRRFSSTWPDDAKWSLHVAGARVPLANYGANCGLTGPAGVAAPLMVWDERADVAGKIVVYRPPPRADVREPFADSDYERMTPFDSWPVEGAAVAQQQNATNSIAAPVWDEMTASSNFIAAIREKRPAGVIFATGLNRASVAGLYTFRVPEHYEFPSAYVDRSTGDQLLADARAGKMATLRVEGEEEDAEAHQLIAYLPGRHYGTADDEQIQLRTHTDGPSISQDNGALGLLGVVKYMARLPRRRRPRTLMIELDCRHFMPGAERAWEHADYFHKHPEAREKVRALVAMEHLGQIDYVEDGEEIRPSGRSLPTWIYASGHPAMIEAAYEAAHANGVRSAIVRSPGRLGVNGRTQGPWYGMSRQGQLLGLPTFGVQGDLGAYWAHSAGIDRFDARSFVRQVGTFCQLTGFLMVADLAALQAPPVELPAPTAFQ